MAELIQNGFFNDNHMTPWERCADNELGESWICHGEEEPDFDRLHWHYTAADLTDYNPVFLTSYNLELNENDAVKQSIDSNVRATGDFHFWAECGMPDISNVGDLYAFVCYGDCTFDYTRVAHDDIDYHGPNYVKVHTQSKRIEKVMICVVDSPSPWYISGISMEGADTKSIRPYAHLESRIAILEDKIKHLYCAISKEHKAKLDLSGKGKKKV